MREGYKARDYQDEARIAVMDGFNKAQRGLLVLPTGAGKNFVACSLMEAYSKKNILFLADRNELIEQPWQSIVDFLAVPAGVEKAEQHCTDSDRLVVGSIQSMVRRYQSFRPDRFDLIIADEAHLSMGESWQKVLKYFEHAKILGMTATPFRTDGQNLMSFFEAEFYRKTIDNLQNEGWLVPLEIEDMGKGIDISMLQVKRGIEGKKFDEQEVAQTIEPYLEAIAKDLLERFDDRCTLAFLPLVEISQKFATIARAVGLKAEHVDGKDPARKEKVEKFKAGDYQLLCNSQLLHTGFDAPVCSATLNLTPMFSTVRYQQIIGRSTRPLKGVVDNPEYTDADRCLNIALSDKPDSLIFDPLWQFGEHTLMVPEALSAESMEEAQELRASRKKKGEKNLGIAQRAFVQEREAEMLRRLETERRQREQRKGDVISVREFAIRTGNHFLASYKPVYQKERRAVGKFDKDLLRQRGLDPDSVTCQGEADLAIRSVNIRRARALAEIGVCQRLIRCGIKPDDAYGMPARHAQAILDRFTKRTHPA